MEEAVVIEKNIVKSLNVGVFDICSTLHDFLQEYLATSWNTT